MKTHNYKSIGGWCNFEDIYSDMVQKHKKGHFVEIGTFFGKSASYMGVEIANSGHDIKFDTIDTFEGSPDEIKGKHKIATQVDMFAEAQKHLKDLPVNIIKNDSIKASRKYKKGTLDFVFVDGSHLYEDVKRDIEVWMKKVKKGGYIGGHDYDNKNVHKAVNELLGDCPANATSWLWQV